MKRTLNIEPEEGQDAVTLRRPSAAPRRISPVDEAVQRRRIRVAPIVAPRARRRAAVTSLLAALIFLLVHAERPVTGVALVPAAATARVCADVTFVGVADFRLKRIRATGVSCSTARRVVRGARLHERWRSLGFSCRVTGFVPEIATLYRCGDDRGRVITFRAG
jgi:hypothetical protein